MKVTIIGGGNVGTLLCGELSSKGHEVYLYTSSPEKWNEEITVNDRDTGKCYSSKIAKISNNLEECVKARDIIIVTFPSYIQKELIEKFEKINLKDTILCFYPGLGGSELRCEKLLNNNVTICGPQRIKSVVRLDEYGKSVHTSGARKLMVLGCIPQKNGEKVRSLFEELIGVKTELLPNYLNVTLTPSNPLLHPSRLYGIFKDYSLGKTYDRIPLFYEEWDDFSSEVYIKCDNELHEIIDKLDKIDLSKVIRVLPYYESTDKITLSNKIRSIRGFKGITTPSKKVEDRYIPDLSSRYFSADIPYGLLIIKDFGLITNTQTPMIDEILMWYQKLVDKEYLINENKLGKDSKNLNLPSNFGIDSIDKIYDFYIREVK